MLRPARVLFVSFDQPALAIQAEACATRLGEGRLEARSSESPGSTALFEALIWADTVVIIADGDRAVPLEMPEGTLSTRWHLPADAGGAAVSEHMQSQVRGMIGGLRLLERTSA